MQNTLYAVQDHLDNKTQSDNAAPAAAPTPPLTPEERMAQKLKLESEFKAKLLEGYAEAHGRDSDYLPDEEKDAATLSAGRRLFEASLKGEADAVEQLLREHAENPSPEGEPPLLEWVNKWSESALHIAADRGHANIVRSLIHAGAQVNAINQWKATPLIAAAYWGHAGAVEALLLAGADQSLRADNGKTAVTVARQAEHLECLKLLKTAPKKPQGGNKEARPSPADAGDGWDDSDDFEIETEPSNMPADLVKWCEDGLTRMAGASGAKHVSLLHWLFSLPTCEDRDIVGYLKSYLGSRMPGLEAFAHEFADKKYEWKQGKKRLAEGKEALFAAEREAIANGSRDVGDVSDAAFVRVFTERTLGLCLNAAFGQIVVKGAMPNSAAAKRQVPTGSLLTSVNGEAVARNTPLKEVQRLISRAERPVTLSFEMPPKEDTGSHAPEGSATITTPAAAEEPATRTSTAIDLDTLQPQLTAIQFPSSLLQQLHDTLRQRPFAEPFKKTPEGHVVVADGGSLRVAAVEWLLPLRDAARKLDEAFSTDGWASVVAVHADCSGSGDGALAMLDPLALSMRHSSKPTHAIGVISLPPPADGSSAHPTALSITWPLDPTAAETTLKEATRDRLRGRYMLDSPLCRAVQSVAWLDLPSVWASEEERRATERRYLDARQEHNDARRSKSKPTAAGPPPPPSSASGRQVFLAWLAQQQQGGANDSGSDGGGGPAEDATAAMASQLAALAMAPNGGKGSNGAAPKALLRRDYTTKPWRVYSDLPQVHESLRRPEFTLVTSRDEAEILFTGDHIREFGALAEAGGADGLPLLNQFPHESVLIAKNLLAEAAQGKYGTRMPWLAHTYTLPHELPAFVCEQWPSSSSFSTPHDVSDHAESEKNGNAAMASAATTFIIKPWNMSRSRGVLITRERRAILTTCNEAFGPRLACSYIERPLLLENRKFDCRMYVAVTSLSPPVCHLYSKFYARVSANNFAHAPLSDHLAHLTVLKYEGVPQEFVGEDDLIRRLTAAGQKEPDSNGDHDGSSASPPFDWEGVVRPRLLSALADTFRLLVEKAEEGSVWSRGRCRALYGIDCMFATSSKWQEEPGGSVGGGGACDVQPVLLEVNYSADFGKMLSFRPAFLDEAFARLFLEEEEAGSELWWRLQIE